MKNGGQKIHAKQNTSQNFNTIIQLHQEFNKSHIMFDFNSFVEIVPTRKFGYF